MRGAGGGARGSAARTCTAPRFMPLPRAPAAREGQLALWRLCAGHPRSAWSPRGRPCRPRRWPPLITRCATPSRTQRTAQQVGRRGRGRGPRGGLQGRGGRGRGARGSARRHSRLQSLELLLGAVLKLEEEVEAFVLNAQETQHVFGREMTSYEVRGAAGQGRRGRAAGCLVRRRPSVSAPGNLVTQDKSSGSVGLRPSFGLKVAQCLVRNA